MVFSQYAITTMQPLARSMVQRRSPGFGSKRATVTPLNKPEVRQARRQAPHHLPLVRILRQIEINKGFPHLICAPEPSGQQECGHNMLIDQIRNTAVLSYVALRSASTAILGAVL
jgi:hypothetical protein